MKKHFGGRAAWGVLLLGGALAAVPAKAQTLDLVILSRQAPKALRWSEDQRTWRSLSAKDGLLLLDGHATTVTALGGGQGFYLALAKEARPYAGTLLAGVKDGRLSLINRVPLDDYVAGVAAAESGGQGPEAFRVALAFVVRSYALGLAPRHAGADLCDLSHCQVYHGRPRPEGIWLSAARQASALKRPRPAWPLFMGNCGGLLDHPSEVWGRASKVPGYPLACAWQGRALCALAPDYRWHRRLARREVALALQDLGVLPPGATLEAWGPEAHTSAGRILAFSLRWRMPQGPAQEGSVSSASLYSAMGRRWGWQHWPSLTFSLKAIGDEDVYAGRGQGHGSGLCLAGAQTLAQDGWSATKILDFYFPPADAPRAKPTLE